MAIEVTGASDDLIEIRGDVHAEFSHYDEDASAYLACSDGSVLSVQYTREGLWRINRVVAGTSPVEHQSATDPEGEYTDRCKLTGVIRWVVCGRELIRAKP